MANIIIVDDHSLVLESFPLLIEKITNHKVIQTFKNPEEALTYIKSDSDKVDLVLTDMKMPQMHGVNLIKAIKEMDDDINIMALSQYDLKEYIIQSIENGALGYVLKDITAKDLEYAIEKVINSEMFLCHKSLKIYIDAQKEKELKLELTSKEKEILNLIAHGKTSKEISSYFKLTPDTIHFHRKNIMSKIGACNVADLTRTAFKIGLLDIG